MSYHNHETRDTYQYLATQSGSVTGLTKDGQAIASSKYQLYGSTKDSTDETGNPYAYNGEARDSTGLDYLRARYYDSQAGTFLTEDSYQGELDDPLSQNRYSYVHNNPVNYTDPSGHFWKSIKRAASNAWNGVKRAAGNAWNATKTFVGNAWNATKTFVGNAWNATKEFVGNAWNTATNWFGNQVNGVYQSGQQVYHSASSYAQAQYQQMQAQVQAQQLQAVRHEYAQATGIKGTPKSREARNLLRNWGAALAKTLRHVCTTAKRVGKQIVKAAKKIDWKKVAIVATATVAAVAVTVATAGVAAPFVAGMLGVTSSAVAMGTVGLGTTIAIGATTGAISGAAGGAAYGLVEGILSGRDSKTTAQNTLNGAVSGFTSGALTGGFGSALTGSTAGLSNPLLRYGADTASETAVDTLVDSATGGNVTPTSIATSLALNAVTEGVSVRGAKGAKADVNTNKPKAGDVPVTKSHKDMTPVQQLALPGPSKQFTSGTDFSNFNSSYKDRLDQTPKNGGTWTGMRGESKFISNDDSINSILSRYDQNGITYKNAVPDFSPVTQYQVEIPNMTISRSKNFGVADSALASDLGVTKADIRKYRKDNQLTWHELNDMETMQLVPTEVNRKFGHLGGISEIKHGIAEIP